MNEGWASFWHTTILTQKALNDSEVIDYAAVHSGTMGVQPGSINPYKLGLELFRDIEDRWNKGRFGLAWEACDDRAARREWDKKLGLGREKIFEVRRHYNDVTFIDEFLTVDFALVQKLFVYDFNQKSHSWEILTHEFKKVKRKLLFQLTNFGQPFIAVVDANRDNKGELLLHHRHESEDLRVDYMNDTLGHLAAIWRRPVCLLTRINDRPVMVRHNGEQIEEKELGPEDMDW
jgi:stage V sporulation protein R